MTENNFIHLKAHSEYSIIDGLLRIKPWLKRVKELAMPAVAITDHSNLFALVKFYKTALSLGIKPIIGADITLVRGDEESYEKSSVTLLAQNKQGYHHLTCLLSDAYIKGQSDDDQPCVHWEWLQKANAGLIVLSGAREGDIGQALLANDERKAERLLKEWSAIFSDRFYIELQRTGRHNEEDYIHAAVALATKHQVPVVATNEVRFLTQDDFEAHEARVCIHSGYVLDDQSRPRDYSEQQYLRSAAEMTELFADIPEALENTLVIAKRCSVPLTLGEVYLPKFPIPDGSTIEDYFSQEVQQGLEQRRQSGAIVSSAPKTPYEERLAHELSVINRMGFAGYFLIVADFIRWAKQHAIPVGPGRGSGAGSLIAFALGITELDPLAHNLLFERFLNPERVSMPDFDIDFCMVGRDRVIEYVAQRYGRDAVAQIITYGTMAAKAVVRDVGRVLGMPYGFVDKLAKLIPFEIGMTLDKALEQEEQLAERYAREEEVTSLIDLAKKLEGLTRNAGKHAGGVVIAPTSLTDFVPLYCEAGSLQQVTQFDKDDVETIGLVKFDFLGLKTLTIIDWALQAINKKRQLKNEESIKIEHISMSDSKTFALLQSCATTAVFQLESRGMKDLIRRLKPEVFDEITALVALFRPGPLQSGMVDDFIARKHGLAPVSYPHPELESILASTYGVILYQEQVMQIAQILAGYSLGAADLLRRAMGKKKPEEMAKQRAIFLQGAKKRDIEEEVAEHIFDLMEKFAGYGFNKSHSAAYALIAYQTAWLKAHYPAEFMAAVLSADMDNTDKVVAFLDEAANMKLKVNSPDINQGVYAFKVNSQGEINYGLGAIKGAGEAVIEEAVKERQLGGEYQSLFDFCQRLMGKKLTRRVLEPLIRSGSMDCLHSSRAELFASIDKATKAAEQHQHNQSCGQGDLFASIAPTMQVDYLKVPTWPSRVRLQGERDTLGLYLTGHPLEAVSHELAALHCTEIIRLSPSKQTVLIAGLLTGIRSLTTRSGSRMAILTLEDKTGRIEATVFSQLYDEVRADLEKDQIYCVTGNAEEDQFSGGTRFRVESLQALTQVREARACHIVLQLDTQEQTKHLLANLAGVITPYKGGSCKIVVQYRGQTAGAKVALGEKWQVTPSSALLADLVKLCGEDQVLVGY